MIRARCTLMVVVSAMLVLSHSPAIWAAEPSTTKSMPADVQKTASEIEQLRLALLAPDASTRYAAFVQAVESGRTELREVAISAGISSPDQVMQQMAVRAAFIGVSFIQPDLVEPEKLELDQDDLEELAYKLFLRVASYDWNTGAINASSDGRRDTGQINGNIITYVARCTVKLQRIDQTWGFQGATNCHNRYGVKVSYQMR